MRFLRVSLDTAISFDKVKMIKKTGATSCKVFTDGDVYEINMPYEALLESLNSESTKLDKIYNIMKETTNINP